MSEYPDILYAAADRIATITLNRPDSLNAYTDRMATSIKRAFADAAQDPSVRVILLTGAGRGFCAGADMRFMSDKAVLTTAFAQRGLIAEHGTSWLLPRLVGPAHALDLLLSSRRISAAEAGEMGLVNKVFTSETFAENVLAYARLLAET